MSEKTFKDFSLKPYLFDALEKIGFQTPTEIQQLIIPSAEKGVSVVGQSQTGTGKTHAFLLPILSKMNHEIQEVQAVITAPTRELANQIYQEALKLIQYANEEAIQVKLFVGGTDKVKAIEKLKTQPQLVIGTPGRIYDLVSENALQIHTASILVVDEADLMMEMGFLEDVDKIASRLPKDLQMFVFSATIPENLRPFLKKYMENPLFIQVEPKRKTAKNIEHVLIPIRHRDKIKLLKDLLIAFNPYLAIVFTNTKQQADYVATELSNKGLKVGVIHGDLSPRERKKMMTQIRNLDYQYIVASDLASRGIDIEGVSHVINYEIPKDLNFYIHRSGRTGRGEYTGISAILYDETNEHLINRLEGMGITFANLDLVGGELKTISDRNERRNRKKKKESVQILNTVKKPKKVKPGYKKKLREEVERQKRIQSRKKR